MPTIAAIKINGNIVLRVNRAAASGLFYAHVLDVDGVSYLPAATTLQDALAVGLEAYRAGAGDLPHASEIEVLSGDSLPARAPRSSIDLECFALAKIIVKNIEEKTKGNPKNGDK